MFCMLLVFLVPNAWGQEMVYVEGIGMVSQSTAKVIEILNNRRAKALAANPKAVPMKVEVVSPPKSVPDAVVALMPKPEPVKEEVKAVVVAKAAEEKPVPARTPAVAEVSWIISPSTANPVVVEKKQHTFDEYTLYAGGWYAMGAKSKGIWSMGEWTHWWAGKEQPRNFGVGLTAKADKGWSDNGYHWGYFAPGLNLSYYQALGEEDDILAKFRPMYRFGEKSSGKGFMPGGYLQYAHTVGGRDKLIASADGQYFGGDSYLGLALMWEHRFNRDIKVRFGPFAGLNFMRSETVIGLGPEIVFDLYDRIEIGISANFAKGGPFLGAFAGYKVNTDLRAIDANLRERSVKLEQKGVEMNQETTVTKVSTGDYVIMPGTNQVVVSEKTMDEETSNQKGEVK